MNQRFTKTLLDLGISRAGYCLGTPSVIVCKTNIKSTFSVQRFYEKAILSVEGGIKTMLAIKKAIKSFD